MLRQSKCVLLLLLIIVLAACGGASPTATPVSLPATATVATAANGNRATTNGLRTFVIVPQQSKASYLVNEEFFGGALAKLGIDAGKADVVGSTQAIEGQLQLDFANLAAPLGDNNFTVQLNTLVTGEDRRDQWIRENGPTFNTYQAASFQATAIEDAPSTYVEGKAVSFALSGDLTIREVTQPVTFAVTATLTGDTLTGVATTRLLMSNFGIEPPNFANTLTVADEFGIKVQFTAQE